MGISTSVANAPQILNLQDNGICIVLFTENPILRIKESQEWHSLEWIKETYPELYTIINCESSFRPEVCNAEYGCSAGQGLAQIIPSTLAYCEVKLGRVLNALNTRDNLDCAIFLYETDGNIHWESSKTCWDK